MQVFAGKWLMDLLVRVYPQSHPWARPRAIKNFKVMHDFTETPVATFSSVHD
jgi:hypothetical protein